MVALRLPLEDGLDLGEDSFAWPHPMRSGEALFVVDDAAEQAAREVASRGREGVRTTLAKMGDAIAVVVQLDAEAQR
jgi:acyl dehydratase